MIKNIIIPLIIELLPEAIKLLVNFISYKNNYREQKNANSKASCVNSLSQRQTDCDIRICGKSFIQIHFKTWRG